jgi:hypothetical protein
MLDQQLKAQPSTQSSLDAASPQVLLAPPPGAPAGVGQFVLGDQHIELGPAWWW